ncbi:MAG: diacylglycerol kinase [Eggerthellaceae bacterium]|nr:diacylglycerol kinase [Eggerthellaceae bacterium]
MAKRTKDIAAAAVLVAAIASVVVGLLVWVPLIIPHMFS